MSRKPPQPGFYLNSYSPLIISAAGRTAAKKHRHPPLIDGSIRREPDLQHRYPSISCLCRAGKFATRLRVGYIVAYVTAKRRYEGVAKSLRYLSAILQVRKVCGSHQKAAAWYRHKKRPLPSNCMVYRNRPKPFDHSHQRHGDRGCFGPSMLRSRWDSRYQKRAWKYPIFVICNCLFRDLDVTAPIVTDAALKRIFGELPSTQNPRRYEERHFWRFISHLKIQLRRKPRHMSLPATFV